MDKNTLFTHSRDAVSFMVSEIAQICRNFTQRAPGSSSERRAAEYMAELLQGECGCSEVGLESFEEHPDAFYSYFYFSMTFDCLCAVFFFFAPVLSIVSGSAALLLFLIQFVLYKQLIDPLFPKKQSVNVTAVRPAAGEVRQRIFLNGHIDAAWEFPLNYYFGGIIFELPGVMAIIGVVFYIVLSICRLTGAGEQTVFIGTCGLIFVPFFLLVAVTYNPRRIVDGANDNLSGCLMGIALLREMERLGIRPEHTEVGVILTGSEEAGLRGAKAWGEAHKGEYRDVPTYILSYDTIHDPAQLVVNVRDLNGTVKADETLCGLFLSAAEEAGVPCKKGLVPLLGGSTDSAAFTQAGFRSAGITGLSHRLENYYHTRKDSFDNLNEEGLENCYKATVSLIDILERQDSCTASRS